MWWVMVVRWSWLEAMRPARSLTLALAFGLCLYGAMSWGTARVAEEQAAIAAAAEENRRQWLAQPPQSPHAAAHFPVLLAAPPGPLAALVAGAAGSLPTFLYTDAHRVQAARGSRVGEGPLEALLGPFDVGAVVGVVGSLVAALVGAEVVAAERARGTLRQLLIAVPSPPGWLAAAATGRLLALWAITAGAAAVAWLAAGRPGLPLVPLGAWLGLSASYMAAWLWLGLLTALRASRPATGALGALAVWIALVVVLPRGVVTLLELDAPYPDGALARASLRVEEVALRQRQGRMVEALRVRGELAGATGFVATEGPAAVRDVIDAAADQARRREEAGQRAWLETQARRQLGWAWLSPVSLYVAAASALAGTDTARHARFERQAAGWRRAFLARLNGLEEQGQDTFSAYGAIPAFSLQEASTRAAIASQALAWGLLMLLWVGSMAVAMGRFGGVDDGA
ncbi:MAG: DUF3526 domain-containing protein [Candidatus Sericytochromatia bacterium]|nr:DUF3526 domain-containing protein [Candidatus Sericytochromatia bacterium]